MSQAGDRRLVVFLALSIALHVLWLALPLRTKATGVVALPLSVRLASPEKSVVVGRHLPRGHSAIAARHLSPGAEASVEAAPAAPPAIDLDAAFATARSLGRETPSTHETPPPPLTVETAIARATQPDAAIETRGANGEYVTRTRRSRCVTPLLVPHFLEGKTMLTQCEALKG